jgi:diguanylate cyclase (GGDEF)-like protein/PAS domain S-box-containing protein
MTSNAAPVLYRRLNDLLDHLPAGVVLHGADGRILCANRCACELLDQRLEQLIGTGSGAGAWNFVRVDKTLMGAEEYPVNVVLRTGAKVSDLIVGIQTEGREPLRWLICNAYPEFDEGSWLHGVVVCFTDCTALKRAKQSLQKSEERLRLVLQGSTDASWDCDLVSGESYYAERWWQMLGRTPGELPAGPELWMALLHADDAPTVRTFMRNLLDGTDTGYSIEFRLRHRDSHYVPLLSRGFVLRDVAGKALRISGTNTDLSERKAAEQRIYELAHYDQLTGLPNRRLLVEELDKTLARCKRSGRPGALLLLDLDNFRLLNDTMGRDAGDMLLCDVARRLPLAMRGSDRLARPGGDEFALVLEDLGSSVSDAVTETNHVLDQLVAALSEPYALPGGLFSSTPSIGVVLFGGVSADVETTLKQAELAMYQAKAEGGNKARFFDPDMQVAADNQAALENALRLGLSGQQFVLFCQPQFDADGRPVGAEVLVRWRRADGSMLGPAEFIGLAESSGLIVPLGLHILEQSCRALGRWRDDPGLAGLKLAVNVSVHQLRNAAFFHDVADLLAATGAPPHLLCLELTESVFADDVADMIQRMHALRSLGLHFSLDDFGTGYSSLAYLRRFPLAALKIDRSFVHDVHLDPDAVPIVEAIIALARKLKLDIVAEGVENEEQRDFLLDGGCGALQGYLLGRPMPIEDFERMFGGALQIHGPATRIDPA